MALPKITQDRIESDAKYYATVEWGDMAKFPSNDVQHISWGNSVEDYTAGATAETERSQPVIDAFEALLNMMPKGDALRYFHAKDEVIKGRQLLQQWNAGKEVENDASHDVNPYMILMNPTEDTAPKGMPLPATDPFNVTPDRQCLHCGKELNRDRNLCRECGEEVGNGIH